MQNGLQFMEQDTNMALERSEDVEIINTMLELIFNRGIFKPQR